MPIISHHPWLPYLPEDRQSLGRPCTPTLYPKIRLNSAISAGSPKRPVPFWFPNNPLPEELLFMVPNRPWLLACLDVCWFMLANIPPCGLRWLGLGDVKWFTGRPKRLEGWLGAAKGLEPPNKFEGGPGAAKRLELLFTGRGLPNGLPPLWLAALSKRPSPCLRLWSFAGAPQRPAFWLFGVPEKSWLFFVFCASRKMWNKGVYIGCVEWRTGHRSGLVRWLYRCIGGGLAVWFCAKCKWVLFISWETYC